MDSTVMSPNRFRVLGRSDLARITACGRSQVFTPAGWADVVFVSEADEQELKEITRRVLLEAAEGDPED